MKNAIIATTITLGSLVGCTPINKQIREESLQRKITLEQRIVEDKTHEETMSGLLNTALADIGPSYFSSSTVDFIIEADKVDSGIAVKYFKLGQGTEQVLGFATLVDSKPVKFIAVNQLYSIVRADEDLAKINLLFDTDKSNDTDVKELSTSEFNDELHKSVLQAYQNNLISATVGADSVFRAIQHFYDRASHKVDGKLTSDAEKAIQFLFTNFVNAGKNTSDADYVRSWSFTDGLSKIENKIRDIVSKTEGTVSIGYMMKEGRTDSPSSLIGTTYVKDGITDEEKGHEMTYKQLATIVDGKSLSVSKLLQLVLYESEIKTPDITNLTFGTEEFKEAFTENGHLLVEYDLGFQEFMIANKKYADQIVLPEATVTPNKTSTEPIASEKFEYVVVKRLN